MAKITQDGCTGVPWLACALAAIWIAPSQAQTASETVLHNFPGWPTKGRTPSLAWSTTRSATFTGPLPRAEQQTRAWCSSWIQPARRRCCTASRAGPTGAAPMQA
jgi:hypothetical protein